MIRYLRALAGAALVSAFAGAALAADEPPAPTGEPLTPAQIKEASRTDELSFPTPGELLAAIDKLGKPDWASTFRPPITTNYSSRAQMAINMGGLIADGYIAVEALNTQQVKNIGHDIIALAKPLGVGQDILNRGKSLTEFADGGQWDTLKEELEATQNEVKSAMREKKDPALITLVTLGGWLRATGAMANYIAAHYTPEAAGLLRQPGIVQFLDEQLTALPEKLRDDSSVRRARDGLGDIEKSLSFPAGTPPTQDVVEKLDATTTQLLKDLATKK